MCKKSGLFRLFSKFSILALKHNKIVRDVGFFDYWLLIYWFIEFIDLFSWVFLRVLYGDKCPDMYNSFWKAEVIVGLNFNTKLKE